MKEFDINILKKYLLECNVITHDTAIEESTLLESLQMDSLDGAQIFMKIEEDYQVFLPFSVYSGITMGDLIRNIKEVLEDVCYKEYRTD